MKTKIRRIDFSPTEWIEGTTELDNATRGLYITACSLMWARGGTIERELLRLASRDHGHAFNRQFDTLVATGKLTIKDGQIANKRAINELQKANKRSINLSQNGTKGNRIKRIKTARRDAASRVRGQPSTINHQPSKSSISESLKPTIDQKPAAAPNGAEVIDLEFEAFWREVPRKVGKGQASRAYRAARKKTAAEPILMAIKGYAEQRRGEDERYTKHPATWLNSKCWLDEAAAPTPPPARPFTIGVG